MPSGNGKGVPVEVTLVLVLDILEMLPLKMGMQDKNIKKSFHARWPHDMECESPRDEIDVAMDCIRRSCGSSSI
jgi:hypothetical protein